jgi:hypothetical protein
MGQALQGFSLQSLILVRTCEDNIDILKRPPCFYLNIVQMLGKTSNIYGWGATNSGGSGVRIKDASIGARLANPSADWQVYSIPSFFVIFFYL